MTRLIALTGKGGVGKTTLSALLIKTLVDKGLTPVLAIDADPNSCLDTALGVTVRGTVGRAREEVRREAGQGAAVGISKTELLQMKIEQSLVEADGFDLISMGRPEGAGCYCYANNVLKSVIAELSGGYPYVVLDNEAGLENLSRRIVQTVDILAIVSDGSRMGLNTIKRLTDLAREMEVRYSKLFVIVNRLRTEPDAALIDEIKEHTKADAVFFIPDDAGLARMAEESQPLTRLPADHPVGRKIEEMVELITLS